MWYVFLCRTLCGSSLPAAVADERPRLRPGGSTRVRVTPGAAVAEAKDGILGLVVANEHSMQRLAPTILFSMNAMMKKKSQRAIRIGTGYSRDEPSVVRLHHSKGIVWISHPKRKGTEQASENEE